MPDIEIIEVNRPHQWIAKRGESPADHTCRVCGKRRAAVATSTCYVEEVEREVIAPNA